MDTDTNPEKKHVFFRASNNNGDIFTNPIILNATSGIAPK